MKKIFLPFLSMSLVILIGCTNEESKNVGKVTNYPTIEIAGDNPYFIPQGGTFVEPGVIAKEGSTSISFTTIAKGNYRGANTIDTNKPDEYTVEYTATNKDGFKASGTRKVIVYKTGNLVDSIEGVYISTVSRNNVSPPNQQNLKYVYIWKNTNGTFEVSDAFGGWYQYGRGFGIGYITPGGIITAVNIPTNNFTFATGLTNTGFGGPATITELTVNPTTKKLVLKCGWVAPTVYAFVSTLTQVQL
jgi:Domain of unknown function (DUF5011)